MVVKNFSETVPIIQSGGIGVVPTDTLYGIVASAFSKEAVERIYAVRGRSETKPCIILLPEQSALTLFGIGQTEEMKEVTEEYWPGPVSIVFPCEDEHFEYLHRGTGTLAFRVPHPRHRELVSYLKETGPLIAPSANIQGEKPSETLEDAYRCFGEKVDFYVDGGNLSGKPSTVLSIIGEKVEVLRQGVTKKST